MEKRVIAAVVLSIAILIAYQILYVKPRYEELQKEQAAKKETVAESTGEKVAKREEVSPPAPAGPAAATPPEVSSAIKKAVTAAQAEDIIVETDLYTAVFTTRGGRLKSWVLKHYLTDDRTRPLDMIATKDERLLPFDLRVGRDGLSLGDLILRADRSRIRVEDGRTETLSMSLTLPGALEVERKMIFRGDSYFYDVEINIRNLSKESLPGGVCVIWNYVENGGIKKSRYGFSGLASLVGTDLQEIKFSKIKEDEKIIRGDINWLAFEDRYFASAFIPLSFTPEKMTLEKEGEGRYSATISHDDRPLAPGEARTYRARVFFGPKITEELEKAGKDFRRVLNYGWFDMISRPLLVILKVFNRFLHNWGLAIILLTILIKILFYPLTHKSYKSMKQMQELQPLINKLRQKYKNDREALNREMMQLYRARKINPFGGCLPMLLQIPVFFGLYRVLLYSVELRNSPFFLWITDLSAKDPLYITPILMGASMFLQQKMTPTTADPAQAKLMMFMPIIFTVMFLNFPSGLVIYWLMNNILSIGQQYYINKYLS